MSKWSGKIDLMAKKFKDIVVLFLYLMTYISFFGLFIVVILFSFRIFSIEPITLYEIIITCFCLGTASNVIASELDKL
ncbi:hypothetical protein ASF12_23150 [Paenibacillus sp. Leaf72]|nr:hypothetical protein ASF12_23150 [Paenibacillus sp. Leaf72]